MKKVILFAVCCLFVSSYTEAQTKDSYKLKNEITVRWGVVDDEDWYYNGHGYIGDYSYWGSPLERYNNGKYYYDDQIYTQALTVSYTSELKRWLALSINASYSGVFQNERETASGKKMDKYTKHRIAIYPMVRFTYFNRPSVRLYSAVGLGFGMKREGWSNNDDYDYENYVSGQITFFGISVGKKLFASWEFGYGSMGILNMGVGYRF